jgi:hypothetical protein
MQSRDKLIKIVEKLEKQGDFARLLGKCALIADNTNLEKLVRAFPEHFTTRNEIRLVYGRNDNLS